MNESRTQDNPEVEQSIECCEPHWESSWATLSGVSKTSEWFKISTQVNMDAQFPKEELNKVKKRNRKKQYKRRKKEKFREEERSAKVQLANLIDLIYRRQMTFQKCQDQVQECLEVLAGGDKFHSFLNEAIRIHVNNLQKDIWDFMQTIIQENPFEKFDQDQNFYLRMVDKIYQEYQKLKYSSREIEKIINLFMSISEVTVDTRTECQNLDISTFNYLIESDESIKNLIHICQRRISIRHKVQVLRLKEIGDMMGSEEYYQDDQDDEEEITEKSTSVEEEEHDGKKSHRRKKKKKTKQAEFSNKIEDILARLNQMIIIDEARIECKAEASWLSKLAQKYSVST